MHSPPARRFQAIEKSQPNAWLLKLRNWALLGQFLHTLHYLGFAGIQKQYLILLLLASVSTAGHLVLRGAFKSSPQATPKQLPLVLLLDSVLHTALLAISGGAANPFTLLFIVQVVASAVALPLVWAFALTLWSSLCFGGLLRFVELDHAAHHNFDAHLYGMWLAYIFTSIVIAYAIAQIISLQKRQAINIQRLERIQTQHSKLASLATLSAGAAHEIATPLGTIAIVASELRRKQPNAEEMDNEIDLIEAEINRCRRVLDQMKSKGGLLLSEVGQEMTGPDLVQKVRQHFAEFPEVQIEADLTGAHYLVQIENLLTSVSALVDNAIAASAETGVVLRLKEDDLYWRIEVEDWGSGIDASIVDAIKDPFFSTKNPGEGMGLGLFLVETFVQEHNAFLDIESKPSIGTKMTMIFRQNKAKSEAA